MPYTLHFTHIYLHMHMCIPVCHRLLFRLSVSDGVPICYISISYIYLLSYVTIWINDDSEWKQWKLSAAPCNSTGSHQRKDRPSWGTVGKCVALTVLCETVFALHHLSLIPDAYHSSPMHSDFLHFTSLIFITMTLSFFKKKLYDDDVSDMTTHMWTLPTSYMRYVCICVSVCVFICNELCFHVFAWRLILVFLYVFPMWLDGFTYVWFDVMFGTCVYVCAKGIQIPC